jgi:hypothetical protein
MRQFRGGVLLYEKWQRLIIGQAFIQEHHLAPPSLK